MTMTSDQIKSLDLLSLLETYYGMTFQKQGRHYVSFSPFTTEKDPSFVVRCVDGHWLFKDFSSGHGGSFIDFVMLKEGHHDCSETFRHITYLLSPGGDRLFSSRSPSEKIVSSEKPYDVGALYQKLRSNDVSVSRQYLSDRGISGEVIDDLVDHEILLHNRHGGHSWCCFAVFDQEQTLRCLDNHQIGGSDKFVLGRKNIFTRDFGVLSASKEVFVCESIIDYLSIKTLKGLSYPGLALLGNTISFPPELFASAELIISALDHDAGGVRAYLDLQNQFPDKEFSVMNMGESKDPNEYLRAVQSDKEVTILSSQDKLSIYREYLKAKSKSKIARKWGINRSYMYEIVKECEELIMVGFDARKPGRKGKTEVSTLEEASERISRLESEKRQESLEKERYYARSEFLALRLKWSENDQGETSEAPSGKRSKRPVKRQIKKKKKRR